MFTSEKYAAVAQLGWWQSDYTHGLHLTKWVQITDYMCKPLLLLSQLVVMINVCFILNSSVTWWTACNIHYTYDIVTAKAGKHRNFRIFKLVFSLAQSCFRFHKELFQMSKLAVQYSWRCSSGLVIKYVWKSFCAICLFGFLKLMFWISFWISEQLLGDLL